MPSTMRLSNDMAYTDLVAVFDDTELKLHKFVMSETSGWFRTMLSSGFKESASSVVQLEGDDPALLRLMLEYCYSSNYVDIRAKSAETPDLLFAAQMLQIADKYDCRPLVNDLAAAFSRPNFELDIRKSKSSLDDAPFYQALDIIYTLPSASLGGGVRQVFIDGYVRFLPSMMRSEAFTALLRKHADFGADCFLMLRNVDGFGFRCKLVHCVDCGESKVMIDRRANDSKE